MISLLPSATEIVAALGGVGDLVGVTHACDYPPQITGLARVTTCEVDAGAAPGVIDAQVRTLTGAGRSLYTLLEDRIRALAPDLIITQALCDVCAVTEEDVRALAARLSPSPAVLSVSATTLDGVFTDIARVAAALDRDDEAEELVAGLRARLDAVHRALKGAGAPRPKVAVVEWGDPVYAAGHWVPEMVRRAGGIDVLGVAGEYSAVFAVESVAARAPDIVLVAPCGYALDGAATEARRLLALDGWAFLRDGGVWALDANALTSRPGPRLVDGVEVMARLFNPGVFTPLTAGRALRITSATG